MFHILIWVKEMKKLNKIVMPILVMFLVFSFIDIKSEDFITIHVQTVGHEGKDVLTVKLPYSGETENWLYLKVDYTTRTFIGETINIDRLNSKYIAIQGERAAVYKKALTEVGRNEYIVFVTNDVCKVRWSLRENLPPKGVLKTIVMFKGPRNLADLSQHGTVEYVFASGLGAVVTMDTGEVLPVSTKEYVLYVEGIVNAHATLSNAIPELYAHWVWEEGIYGTGVVIAILDTGLDFGHCDISGKVVAWKDFVNSQVTPYDDNGHGTFVSSCAAGQTDPKGVAPGASLMGVKVLDETGAGLSDIIIQGIDWAVYNGADIINISFGAPGGDGTSPLALECNWAVSQGVVVVCTAGGGGSACTTIQTPGDATDVITVGANDYNYKVCSFSSRGPTTDGRVKPDVTAPGVNIAAADAGTVCQDTVMSGTSAATALVSGTCAIVLEKNPAATPQQIKNILGYTAVDLGNPGKDNYFGWGMICTYGALCQAFNNPTPRGKADNPYCEGCAGTILVALFIFAGVFLKK